MIISNLYSNDFFYNCFVSINIFISLERSLNEFLRRDAYKHIYSEIGKRKTKTDYVNINITRREKG